MYGKILCFLITQSKHLFADLLTAKYKKELSKWKDLWPFKLSQRILYA